MKNGQSTYNPTTLFAFLTPFISIVANCSAGQYLDTKNNVCEDCEIGYYSDRKWQKTCTKCDSGTTTRQKGTNSKDDCVSKYNCITFILLF